MPIKSRVADAVAQIEPRILLIRGHKVLLDSDLATLYQVETRALNQAVRRNIKRFPADFMFQLSVVEAGSTFDITNCDLKAAVRGGRRYRPYVFTEQGIAMPSSVLQSKRAIDVNIALMRTFVRLRQLLTTHLDLAHRLEQLEWRQAEQESNVQYVLQTIQQLVDTPEEEIKKRRYGFPKPLASTAKRG